MNCPKCGKAMRKGEMDAKRPITFTPDDEKGKLLKKCIMLRGAFSFEEIRAEICEDCRCVVAEF